MKLIRYIQIPLIALFVFVALAIFAEHFLLSEKNGVNNIEKFGETFRQKQLIAQNILNEISSKLEVIDSSSEALVFEKLSFINDLAEENEISVLVTEKRQPVFWTDNIGCFQTEIQSLNGGFVQLPNGWYHHLRTKTGNFTIDGLIFIKYNYKVKNNYLRNRFATGFYFPRRFEVIKTAEANSYPILDLNNQYAFSVKPSGTIPCKHSLLAIPGVLYLLAFLTLLVILYKMNSHFMHRRAVLKSFLLLVALLGIYSLMNAFHFPRSVYLTTLFSPQDFAFTSYWSSLGELLVFSVILLFWSITFFRIFELPDRLKKDIWKRRIALTLILLFSAAYFVFVRFMIYSMVMNSSISFALYRIDDLTISSLYGYLAVGFLMLSFLFISIKIVLLFRKQTSVREYFILLASIFIALYSTLLFADTSGFFRLSFFFLVISAISFFINRKGVMSQRMMVSVIYVFSFTLFVLVNMTHFITHHENEVQQTMALNLSAEHDPTAELLVKDIDDKLSSDTVLAQLFFNRAEQVELYLRKKYFGGYFREYELQVTLCKENDSLVVQPENTTQPCITFFDEMVDQSGIPLQGTHFYFMENSTGRITYFGKFEFSEKNQQANIFVELNSKLMSEGVGFPELLLPLNSVENRLKNDFSFAKYYNGVLVDRGGKYNYALTSVDYRLKAQNMFFEKKDRYEHCFYKYSDNGFVIVSRPETRVYDYLVSFPYIFVFFFLIALILNFISHPTLFFQRDGNSLKGRIQFSIIGVVLVTLLVIGSGTVFYIISNYRNTYQKGLIDKINSVSLEMEPIFEKANFPYDFEIDYLNNELSRISDVFQTDVNLYDFLGTLVSTSRPELYEKGLTAPIMNNHAFHALSNFHSSSFLQQEQIGKMKYLSAYVPVYNNNGQKTGYLNIPYFTREKAFRQEITTFILAFVNIYVFLLLTSILVAYFISSRITLPLRLIREHLQGVQFGKNPTPIRYRSDDELGILVAEYNRKVDELAESAELLARSERELAWREMARQIAHEIKNPLTPIKLNIQFLQRTDPKTVDNYTEILNRVTRTIIEQIDNLSAIATEFSNFAKIPRAHNERFNLSKRIEEIVPLFDYSGDCKLETHFNGAESLEVYADKEQFSRAIINLVKNAIQAVPEDRKGEINISVENHATNAVVSVADNGKGISEELQTSIFVPNFTTKTSGTGLGLAITKGIVENFGGEIWFETKPDQGTTFFIRIPVLK